MSQANRSHFRQSRKTFFYVVIGTKAQCESLRLAALRIPLIYLLAYFCSAMYFVLPLKSSWTQSIKPARIRGGVRVSVVMVVG